jgi:RimJ/RimL family protein N-acetyltransferase
MAMNNLLAGKLVRLAAYDPDEIGRAFSKWSRDSEYWRLMGMGAAFMPSARQATKYFEKDTEEITPDAHFFGVRTLADDALIGEMGLEVINWSGRDAFLGLSIGERENWGKGYGTEMMRLVLQFAFLEVNLRRVTLTVFEYNPRAIRTYEKTGFRHEGRMRKSLHKEDRRWDMLVMGILREEWLEMQK